jgi:hypothetical protein
MRRGTASRSSSSSKVWSRQAESREPDEGERAAAHSLAALFVLELGEKSAKSIIDGDQAQQSQHHCLMPDALLK